MLAHMPARRLDPPHHDRPRAEVEDLAEPQVGWRVQVPRAMAALLVANGLLTLAALAAGWAAAVFCTGRARSAMR